MADGAISPDLPWVHKEGLALLKADYASQDEAQREDSRSSLTAFYRSQLSRCAGRQSRRW